MRIGKIVCFSFAIFAMTAVTCQAGLIGHWTFDEGSGSTAYDSSGKGYDAALVGGATYTTGQVGSGALLLNGTDAYAAVPYQAELSLADSDYTIAFWGNWAGMNAQGYQMAVCMEWGYSWEAGYFGAYFSDAVAWGHVGGSAAASPQFFVPSFIYNPSDDIGEWAHLALVYDKEAQVRKFYLNGELKASSPTLNPVTDRGADPLCFGVYPLGGNPAIYGAFFNGALDDVQIYNEVLSDSQVATVAAGGVVPEPSTYVMLIFGLLFLAAWKRLCN